MEESEPQNTEFNHAVFFERAVELQTQGKSTITLNFAYERHAWILELCKFLAKEMNRGVHKVPWTSVEKELTNLSGSMKVGLDISKEGAAKSFHRLWHGHLQEETRHYFKIESEEEVSKKAVVQAFFRVDGADENAYYYLGASKSTIRRLKGRTPLREVKPQEHIQSSVLTREHLPSTAFRKLIDDYLRTCSTRFETELKQKTYVIPVLSRHTGRSPRFAANLYPAYEDSRKPSVKEIISMENRHIGIQADSGMGKTLLLKWLFGEIARLRENLPFYFELREIDWKHERDTFTALQEQLKIGLEERSFSASMLNAYAESLLRDSNKTSSWVTKMPI